MRYTNTPRIHQAGIGWELKDPTETKVVASAAILLELVAYAHGVSGVNRVIVIHASGMSETYKSNIQKSEL